jgi:hypothetical protein
MCVTQNIFLTTPKIYFSPTSNEDLVAGKGGNSTLGEIHLIVPLYSGK